MQISARVWSVGHMNPISVFYQGVVISKNSHGAFLRRQQHHRNMNNMKLSAADILSIKNVDKSNVK